MSKLVVTLIDVGWGDSLFLESEDSLGQKTYALIDSNDTVYNRSSYLFLKKFFERNYINSPIPSPAFDFVILTHAHADHGQGLKSIIREFGTSNFWYPKSVSWSALKVLINYANRSNKVGHHQSVDQTKVIPSFGDVQIKILWPPYNYVNNSNENNNSIVISLQLGNVVFILTGDAEAEVWDQISVNIPPSTRMFKIPHHGSVNGTFDNLNNTPWLNNCPANAALAISAHNRPFGHPDQEVIDKLINDSRIFYRTDENYHISFVTDGIDVKTKYSHI